ncbi:MAG: alkaline phosphatase family protein, partial [Akkermansiaceae bacterium]
MKRVAVINVVGLTEGLIGESTPAIKAFADANELSSFTPAFPAVTCTAQSAYLTGRGVESHGIVGNGWYDRESAEVRFWKQSNHLVHGEKIWDRLKRENPDATCAKMFWWYNMYSGADWSVTPRPLYPADGRKVFD